MLTMTTSPLHYKPLELNTASAEVIVIGWTAGSSQYSIFRVRVKVKGALPGWPCSSKSKLPLHRLRLRSGDNLRAYIAIDLATKDWHDGRGLFHVVVVLMLHRVLPCLDT